MRGSSLEKKIARLSRGTARASVASVPFLSRARRVRVPWRSDDSTIGFFRYRYRRFLGFIVKSSLRLSLSRARGRRERGARGAGGRGRRAAGRGRRAAVRGETASDAPLFFFSLFLLATMFSGRFRGTPNDRRELPVCLPALVPRARRYATRALLAAALYGGIVVPLRILFSSPVPRILSLSRPRNDRRRARIAGLALLFVLSAPTSLLVCLRRLYIYTPSYTHARANACVACMHNGTCIRACRFSREPPGEPPFPTSFAYLESSELYISTQ